MANRISQKLSARSIDTMTDVLDYLNRELSPIVRKLVVIFLNRILEGSGSPEGVVIADRGAIYQRTDGGAGSSFWVKESGDGTPNGWVAK